MSRKKIYLTKRSLKRNGRKRKSSRVKLFKFLTFTFYMNIAILSRDPKLYSTKRLKQAGEERGHRVEIIDHMKCVLFIEKKNPMVLYQGKRLDYFDAIIPRIGASVTSYGAAVVRQFEMMKVFTAVESQALIRSRDKLRSLQILSRAGLGLPKTIFMDYSRDTEGIVEAV